MLINSCVITEPALILYGWIEQCGVLGVETHCKYFHIGGKGSSTKELIHDGRTWERKRSCLRQTSIREQDEVTKLKNIDMNDDYYNTN
jgi:hypothetical protein